MVDGVADVVYSVDTSTFMDWQARYYPTMPSRKRARAIT